MLTKSETRRNRPRFTFPATHRFEPISSMYCSPPPSPSSPKAPPDAPHASPERSNVGGASPQSVTSGTPLLAAGRHLGPSALRQSADSPARMHAGATSVHTRSFVPGPAAARLRPRGRQAASPRPLGCVPAAARLRVVIVVGFLGDADELAVETARRAAGTGARVEMVGAAAPGPAGDGRLLELAAASIGHAT